MKYIAYARSIGYVKIEIEADNIDEAIAIAEDTDGGEWIEYDGGWEYDGIEEVKPNYDRILAL